MPTKYTRGRVGSSRNVKCAFCSKHTSNYINFGTSLEINIWVCAEHEDDLVHNRVAAADTFINDTIKLVRSAIKVMID